MEVLSFIDWSARSHDTLYVVAGNEVGREGAPLPQDNFNGLTVAYSTKFSGVYRLVDPDNRIAQLADNRTAVSLVAPGDGLEMATAGGTLTSPINGPVGTSFAAPHVTGTVALLQQYAEQQISAPAPLWDADARRHEVMKAVLMNSADKLNDDGTFALPGNLLGMQRTVLDKNGNNWLQSEAYNDTLGNGELIPLDDQMGAGHLNASRALTQFQSGEFNSDGARVPVIGWDYGHTDGANPNLNHKNRYVFNQQLLGDSFISITVAWDRVVNFDTDGGTPNFYDATDTDNDGVIDTYDTFEAYSQTNADDVINDLDLFLLPKGSTSRNDAIALSTSPFNLEHLFFQIPTTGEYEFWVQQRDIDVPGGQDYAVAWWAVGTGPLIAADFDDDGDVDARDIDILWSIVRETGFDPNDDDNLDLNGDELVNEDDVDFMLAGQLTAGTNRVYGDANLSGGSPELTDYNRWRTGTGGWAGGDFDGSGGSPELNDYNMWRTGPSQFPGTIGEHGGGASAAGLVPEPASIVLMALGLPVLALTARRQ